MQLYEMKSVCMNKLEFLPAFKSLGHLGYLEIISDLLYIFTYLSPFLQSLFLLAMSMNFTFFSSVLSKGFLFFFLFLFLFTNSQLTECPVPTSRRVRQGVRFLGLPFRLSKPKNFQILGPMLIDPKSKHTSLSYLFFWDSLLKVFRKAKIITHSCRKSTHW